MDFGKLFKSAEDAVYEIMVWILLLPKTLFFSMFKPKQAIQYVEGELKKDADERFDEYLSPVLLWLLVAVIPLSLFVIFSESTGGNDFMKEFSEKILPMTTYAMIVPFTYIAWVEAVNKRPVKRSALKTSFYRHCFALAPSQILTALSAGLALVFSSWVLWLVAFLFIPFYESFVFHVELDTSFIKSFLFAIVPQVVLAIVLGIVMFSWY